jgi:CubicO group peptidase (beta-lactamase class C family)
MYKSTISFLILAISLNLSAQNKPFEPTENKDGWKTKNQLLGNETIEKMDSLVSSNEFKQISSIVIAHNGKVIFENYYNDNNSETKHNTRSATKTITGTLIGTLIEKGSIKSVNEKASKFSKVKNIQYPDNRKNEITIEDLLTMSSILECDDWNSNSRGNEENMYLIEDWVKFYWDLPIKGFPEWETKPKDSKYGRSFSYCTSGTVVLGDIINTITGSLENYAENELFSKMDIKDYHWQKTPTGIPMTGGGLGLRSRDLLKIGQLYLNKGKWNNTQIISEDWVQKSISPKAKIEMIEGYEYGYLFWLAKFDNEMAYFMLGTGGNKIAVFPSLNMVVVLTSTYFDGGMESHNQTAKLLSDYIVPEIKKLKK